MKKRGTDGQEERRRGLVEINLLGEAESNQNVLSKARRGCTLPFGGVLIIAAIEVARAVVG